MLGRGRGLQDEDEAVDGVCSTRSGKKYGTSRLFTELEEEIMDEKTDEERTSIGMVGGR